jgi:hypothetical protein
MLLDIIEKLVSPEYQVAQLHAEVRGLDRLSVEIEDIGWAGAGCAEHRETPCIEFKTYADGGVPALWTLVCNADGEALHVYDSTKALGLGARVLSPREFSLRRYDLTVTADRRAAREYARRALLGLVRRS